MVASTASEPVVGFDSEVEDTASWQAAFRLALVDCIKYELLQGKAVFLEGLGKLELRKHRQRESYRNRAVFAFRSETVQIPHFEKLLQLSSDSSSSNETQVELHELGRRVLARLSVAECIGLSEKELRRRIRNFLRELKQELVTFGVSNQLAELGIFYAYSNAELGTLSELFHSAEIFFDPKFKYVLECTETNVFETPTFYNAWEPLETAFGEPVKKWDVNFIDQLSALGFDANSGALPEVPQVSVAVFANQDPASGHSNLIYCTDGLRNDPARSNEALYDQELVVQIEAPANFSMAPEEVPEWPLRMLTLGWVLLQGYKNRSLKEGLVFTHQESLDGSQRSRLNTLLCTEFSKLPGYFMVEDVAYRYINLVGVTQEEAALAGELSPYYLLQLLKFKDLSQVTRPQRLSFVKRRG